MRNKWPPSNLTVHCLLILVLMLVGTHDCSGQGTAAAYERSSTYRARTANSVFADSVTPRWFGDEDSSFWYRVATAPGSHRFVLVDAKSATRQDAFDHDRLAELLAAASGQAVKASRIELQSLTFTKDVSACSFRFAGKSWTFELPSGPLKDGASDGNDAAKLGLQPQERIARSRGGAQRVAIRFDNRLDRELEYFWVMPDGQLRSYGHIGAGQSSQLQTFDGHAWLLKDESGQPVAAFVASAQESLAIIDATTVQPRTFGESRRGRRESASRVSPDGKWRLDIQPDGLTIVDTESDTSAKIDSPQTDGDAASDLSYRSRVWWSPDSSHFVVMRVTPGEKRTINLIESSPKDSIHARLLTVPYTKPGDALDRPKLILVSRDQDWTASEIVDTDFPNPYEIDDLSWSPDSESFSFLYNERGHQCLRLITVNANTKSPRITIDEQSKTFVCYSQKKFLHRVAASSEWIWMSERSGWNHLYLIDATTGREFLLRVANEGLALFIDRDAG